MTHPLRLVGITGLEPATSRPPDVCATNCAKSRSKLCLAPTALSNAGAKVRRFFEITKFSGDFFYFSYLFFHFS